MANVLGELFTDIAESIRSGLGGYNGTMKPAEFSGKIDEIVAMLNEEVISRPSMDGMASTSNLKIAKGNFSPEADRTRITIEHGLGVMPDIIMVYQTGTPKGYDSVEEFVDAYPILSAWGVKSSVNVTTRSGINLPGYGLSTAYGIDDMPAAERPGGFIYCPDEDTFQVGSTADNRVGLAANLNYYWVAISGIGSAAAEPVVQALTVTENGTYTPPEGVDGYSPVVVNVDPTKMTILREQEFTGFVMDATFGAFSPGYVTPAQFVLKDGETYHVVWDGEERECTAYSFPYSGMTMVAVGNGTSLGLPGDGEKFLITYNAALNNSQLFSIEAVDSHRVGIWQRVEMTSADVRYVTFMNHDGTVEYGKKPVAVGDDCADPITRGIFGKPTRESDVQFNYTFYGWATEPNGGADSNWNKAITEDKTVYANFSSTLRYYTITYYDSNGTTVLKTESLAYGSTPSYTASKEGYGFGGWTPAITTVTGNASYVAKWVEKVTFANGSWADIVRIANSGEAQNNFALGDQRTLTYTAPDGSQVTSTIQIVGFNHDDLADGTGKASMSLMTVTADFARCYNAVWDKTYSAGWAGCDLRTELNTTVFNSFPEALRDGIKTVKKTSRIYVDGTDTTGLCESNDDVWVPSFTEMGGTGTSSSQGYAVGDGAKYDNMTMEKITLTTNSYAVSSGMQLPEAISSSYVSTRSGNYKDKNGTINYWKTNSNPRYMSRPHSIYPVVIFGFCI